MIKLTIIIPFYNSKYSLLKTIDSIFNQKISNCDLEVILINDASSDNSLNIVNQFITKHNNISLYTNEINLKQGACRNRGITLAKGKYIWFVDSDDYLENKSLIKLLNIISQKKYDIILFNANEVYGDIKKRLDFYKKTIVDISGIDFLKKMMLENVERHRAVWSKIYNKEFLINSKISFEEGVYWEDVMFDLRTITQAKSMFYTPIIAYNYVKTYNSDMRSKCNWQKFIDTINFCMKALIYIDTIFTDKSINNFMSRYFYETLIKYKNKIPSLSYFDFNKVNELLTLSSLIFNNKKKLQKKHEWIYNPIIRKKIYFTNYEN